MHYICIQLVSTLRFCETRNHILWSFLNKYFTPNISHWYIGNFWEGVKHLVILTWWSEYAWNFAWLYIPSLCYYIPWLPPPALTILLVIWRNSLQHRRGQNGTELSSRNGKLTFLDVVLLGSYPKNIWAFITTLESFCILFIFYQVHNFQRPYNIEWLYPFKSKNSF